jgi:hypothetical protein
MPWPRYKAGPVEYWLTEAFTVFINGVITRWREGALMGTGTGVATSGLIPGTEVVADHLTGMQQIIVSAVTALMALFFGALHHVGDWHKDGHPFPNPWPPKTGDTNPPIPTNATPPHSP